MVTDEMVEKACLAYWGEKNMTSMFGRKTREGVMQSMRNALEAALSTDAEPVAIYKGNGLVDCGESGHHNIELLKLIPANTPLYADPVKTAPAVAVKALRDLVEDLEMRAKNGVVDCSHGVYCAALSALSTQVQDVGEVTDLMENGLEWFIEAQIVDERTNDPVKRYGKLKFLRDGKPHYEGDLTPLEFMNTVLDGLKNSASDAAPASKHGDAE